MTQVDSAEGRPSVLFVCLGNICRSPLAEAAFREAASQGGLDVEVDSAGTGDWNVGNPPDHRAQAIARSHGLDISHLRARQIEAADYTRFSHIFALDHQNLADIKERAPADATAHISLLLDWVPGREGTAVRDPYYGEEDHFTETWTDVSAAAAALAKHFSNG